MAKRNTRALRQELKRIETAKAEAMKLETTKEEPKRLATTKAEPVVKMIETMDDKIYYVCADKTGDISM